MLIAHSQPSPITWTAGSGGEAFQTDTTGLSDGKPARVTRLSWISQTGISIGDYAALRANWDVATTLRVGALLGLVDVAAGVKVEIRGEVAGAPGVYATLGGNALTQLVIEFPDGTFGCWWVFAESSTQYTGIEIRIYNDLDGNTWATDDTTVDIGEVLIAPAAEFAARPLMTDQFDDSSIINFTIGLQIEKVERSTRRRLMLEVTPQTTDVAYGDGQTALVRLRSKLSRGAIAALVPLLRAPAQGSDAAIDYDLIQTTAIYGTATRLGTIEYVPGSVGRWTFSMDFTETPAN
jgi:hypothetical protein